MGDQTNTSTIKLPSPKRSGKESLESVLTKRRSVREYTNQPLTLTDVSQLLWAAQGMTNPEGMRTTPSAGALYPLEVYLIAGNITGLPAGTYKYKPRRHEILSIDNEDKRVPLTAAALGQTCIENGAAVIVLAAVYERITGKYGQRGVRYIHMEAGHAAQNIYLQAASLKLGTVVIGAFDDNQVNKILKMPKEEKPLYLMPVGRIN